MSLHKLERDDELKAAIEEVKKALNSGNKKYLIRCSDEQIIYIYECICSFAVNIFENGDGFALPNLGVFKVKLKTLEGRSKQFGDKTWFKNREVKKWKNREKRLPEAADIAATVDMAVGSINEVGYQRKKKTFNIKNGV